MTTNQNGQDKEQFSTNQMGRRRFLQLAGTSSVVLGGALLAACTAAPTTAPAAESGDEAAASLSGTTITALLSDFPFSHFLEDTVSEFTEETGIEVEMEFVTFPVLLEQSEIELSSGSSNYDVMWQIFIKAQRWMRAGWSTPLDEYVADSGFDLDDMIQTTVDAMTWEGTLYAIPFLAESTQMLYRADVLEEAGVEIPTTFDELDAVLEATHNPPDFHAYVMRTEPNGVHFPFPIWLQGYGGNVFLDPPNDLTPTLNTPEALMAAEDFTNKIMNYSIAGSQIYATPDCQNAMAQGQAGIWVDALGIFPPVRNPETSQVADLVGIALPPGGPAGVFPQIATHGLQIPQGSQRKDAAWEFIAWATSQETMMRAATEAGYNAVNRESILGSPEYGELYNSGDIQVGNLIIQALDLSQPAYRVVPEFPEVGQRIGQAIGEIISGQRSVQEAMDAAQADVEQIMITAGHEIQ